MDLPTLVLRLGRVTDAIREFEDNVEATAAWDGPLFDIWLEYRDLIEESLGPHGEAALALHPPPAGGRCLDIGCGLGDTTFRLAELVGPEGHAHGVDVAPRMIEVAQQDLEREGTPNVSFAVADVETDDLGETYDYAFGRCGTHVLREPGAGVPQRAPAPRAGRPPQHRRLAPQARQRVAAQGRAGRQEVPRQAGRDGRADLRARARSRWPTPTR